MTMHPAILFSAAFLVLEAPCLRAAAAKTSAGKFKPQSGTKGTRHSFRIEPANDNATQYWVIAEGGERVRLPDFPHVEKSTCPGADFTISSDEEWIVADEKLYRHTNEIWLLHRDSPLHYSLVFPSSSRAAWKFYEGKTQQDYLASERYFTRVGPWPASDKPLRVNLYGGKPRKNGSAEVDTVLHFSLKSRTFSLPTK